MRSKPEISIERQVPKITLQCVFDAPIRQVFEAWTTAEHVKCWYRPGGSAVCDCDIDFRVNGKWRIVLRGADGTEHRVSGEYREIESPGRLVQTFRYDGAPQTEAVETLSFAEKDGKTVLTSTIVHKSVENLDWHVRSGAQEAAADVLGRLSDHLESFGTAATAHAPREHAATKPRPNRIPQMAAGVAALALVAGGAYWASHGSVSEHAEAKVERDPAIRVVAAIGVVEAAAATPIRAKTSGKVEAVYCDVGSKVTVGQICARLDPLPFQSTVDRQKATLAETLGRLEKDEAAVAQAKARRDQDQELAKRKPVARKALEKSRLALERAEMRKKSDNAVAVRSRSALEAAEAGLADSEIVAPIEGTVVSRNVEPGRTIGSVKDARDLFTVASDPVVRVVADLSEKGVDEIRVGDKVAFTVDEVPNRVYEGAVGQIRRATTTDEGVAVGRVVVEASNSDFSLKSGMKATVKISIDRRDDAGRLSDRT